MGEHKPQHALFGGSFNPIHKGHVAIVNTLLALTDQLIIMPANCSPFKSKETLLPNELRWKMITSTFPESEQLIISDFELRQKGPSYTHLTLQSLQSQSPHASWHLVIGMDSLLAFHAWNQASDILSNASLWIFNRVSTIVENEVMNTDTFSQILQWFPHSVWDKSQQILTHENRELLRVIDFKPPPISSTEIRQGNLNLDCIPSPARILYQDYLQSL